MKIYYSEINVEDIEYNSSIRSKSNIIMLLLNTIRFLNYNNIKPADKVPTISIEDKIILVVAVSKMSRVFLVEKNKIHTFQFPFLVKSIEGRFLCKFNDLTIDSSVLSILTAVFNEFDYKSRLATFLEKMWEIMSDLDIDDYDVEIIEQLIVYLISFESGYLRFDYDEKNKGDNHPLNHLDFYYSSNNTFKVGLEKRIDHNDLLQLLDLTKKCSNIKL